MLVLLSMIVATALGFVGAQHGVNFRHFDWSLAAVAGTAIGTVLLAGFTGALAWTTSGDVRATIRLADATQEEQRARDRPIIVVRLLGVRQHMLDGASRLAVPVLDLWIKNVGLGPALDLRLRATYAGSLAPTNEVIAVVGVGEEIIDRPISLAGLDESSGGFRVEDFDISGECTDRTRVPRYPIVILADAGLPDQLRAAQEAAMLKAWLELVPGQNEAARGRDVQYRSAVLNNGPAIAEDVRLQLVDQSSGNDYGQPVIVGQMPAHSQSNVTVTCPFPHTLMGCRLTWRDGRGQQSRLIDGAYQSLGLSLPPT